MKRPNFLFVPTLHEGEESTVSWQDTDADCYELDITHNESFAEASRGKCWSDIELVNWNWAIQDVPAALNWQQIEEQDAQGLMWRNLEFEDKTWEEWGSGHEVTWQWLQEQPVSFTTYRGDGEEIAAPDQGYTWADIDSATWSWTNQQDDTPLSWREFEFLPSIGLLWSQHDGHKYSWSGVEDTYMDWSDLERMPARGLQWVSLDAHWLSWQELQQKGALGDGLSWQELEHLPADNQTHRGTDVDIPVYTKASMLRVRGFDGNQPSDYLTTDRIAVIPIFYREDCVSISAVKGQVLYVQVNSDRAAGFDRVAMTMRYDPTALELTDYAAHTGRKLAVDLGNLPAGQVRFQYVRSDLAENDYTGLVTLFAFRALRNTETLVTME